MTWETVPSARVFLGKPGEISSIVSFTASMAARGFSPWRATTTPPTASAPPLFRAPRRSPGPRLTWATSRT